MSERKKKRKREEKKENKTFSSHSLENVFVKPYIEIIWVMLFISGKIGLYLGSLKWGMIVRQEKDEK